MRTPTRPSLTWRLFAVLLAGGCGTPEPTPATPTASVEQGACAPYAPDCGWCGDGVCNGASEDPASCAPDCSCGNGVCEAELGERCDSCPGDCGLCDTYCARPVITRSAIYDIRASAASYPFNGPHGYLYFTAANGKKAGDVARRVDSMTFDTNVYASNFQGPTRIVDGGRPQWEWSADGNLETSTRQYPAEWAKRCYPHHARGAFNLYPSHTSIMEDDEGLGDDKLGEIELSLAGCNSEVFDLGLSSGWATTRRARLVNNYAISYVEYKTWCYKCPGSNSDCQFRVQYGACNGTAGQWNGGRGDGCPAPTEADR